MRLQADTALTMRLPNLFILSICMLAFTASLSQGAENSAEFNVQRFSYKAGSTNLSVRKTTFQEANPFFLIQLHDDENTAANVATSFLKQYGGTLLSIPNNESRYVFFRLNNRKYMFDPNRMFTQKGIRQNLQLFGSYTSRNATIVRGFGQLVLRLIPHSTLVIAIHNNTDGRYSILSYRQDKRLKLDVQAIHINAARDADDFFITTNPTLFAKLKAADFNCVLQKEKGIADDGSLSVYYGNRNQSYVNVEAQSGHYNQQWEMLQLLKNSLAENITLK